MRIAFMGTPDFSVDCLKALVESKHEVVGVFCQPDKPVGRKQELTPPDVKVEALKHNLKIFQPTSLKNGKGVEILEEIKPDLVVVVAYGKILPHDFLVYPKYGCINIHASILPKYRGASPIHFAVLNGDEETGVTAMQMDVGLDTGDMLLTGTVEIGENETAGELHDKLSVLGAQIMSETIDLLLKGELDPKKQDDEKSDYAPMLSKNLCPIDWNESAQIIHNKVRGLSPWPVATAKLGEKTIKIHKTIISDKCSGKPGEVIVSDKKLVVSCGDSTSVEIVVLQTEGKKAMNASDFLRGNPIEKGTILK